MYCMYVHTKKYIYIYASLEGLNAFNFDVSASPCETSAAQWFSATSSYIIPIAPNSFPFISQVCPKKTRFRTLQVLHLIMLKTHPNPFRTKENTLIKHIWRDFVGTPFSRTRHSFSEKALKWNWQTSRSNQRLGWCVDVWWTSNLLAVAELIENRNAHRSNSDVCHVDLLVVSFFRWFQTVDHQTNKNTSDMDQHR